MHGGAGRPHGLEKCRCKSIPAVICCLKLKKKKIFSRLSCLPLRKGENSERGGRRAHHAGVTWAAVEASLPQLQAGHTGLLTGGRVCPPSPGVERSSVTCRGGGRQGVRASGRQGESWGLLLCLTMRLWTQAAGEPLGATACVQWQVARAQSLWGGASGDRRGVGRQQASTRSWSPVWGSEGTGVAAGSTRGREGKHVSRARSPRSPRAGCCELREGRGRTDSRHCIVAALALCSAEIWCPVDTR